MATPFSNQASLSYNGITLLSNTVSGEIVDVLTISKTAVESNYSSGSNITYVVQLNNSGSSDFTNVTITDTMGQYTIGASTVVYPLTLSKATANYFINGDEQTPLAISGTAPITIAGITVPADGNATIIYQGTVNQYAQLGSGSTISNTATATGTGIPDETSDTATVPVSTEPILSLIKEVSPTSVPENGTLTYTFTISNSGNAEATSGDNIVISDTFNPILSSISVTYNGEVLPASSYSYAPSTGVFSTTAGALTVPSASYAQNPTTGAVTVTPGLGTLVVSGTI